MKYKVLIWGTGSFARRILGRAGGGYEQLQKDMDIIGFIDSDPQKQGNILENRIIYPPHILYTVNFDAIIILSVYEEEIKEKLFNTYDISVSKIYNMSTFIEMWSENSDISAFRKNVLLWNSNWDEWKDFIPYYQRWFKVLGFCDKSEVMKQNEQNTLPSVALDDIEKTKVQFILITENDYLKDRELILKLGIKDENLIILNETYIYKTIYNDYCNINCSYGQLNQNITFYLILFPWPRAGFCAALLYFISHISFAHKKGWIPVIDMKYIPNQYQKKGKTGIDNSWEYYFESLSPYSLEEVYQSKNVIIAKTAFVTTLNIKEIDSITLYHKTWNNISMKQELCNSIMTERNKMNNNSKYLGVLFRGTDYVNRYSYGSNKQPSLKQMLIKVKECMNEWKCNRIFLCSEIQEVIDSFEQEFPGNVDFVNQIRFPESTDNWLYKCGTIRDQDNGYLIGLQYFTAIKILSECDCLVAGNTSGSRMAILMNNNNYRHKFVFELGVYGI